MQYDAQVAVHPSRPEIRVFRSSHTVQAEAWVGEVGLQVEGSGLGRPLLVVGESAEAGGECVGYTELHDRLAEELLVGRIIQRVACT